MSYSEYLKNKSIDGGISGFASSSQNTSVGTNGSVPIIQDLVTGDAVDKDGQSFLLNKLIQPGDTIKFSTYGDSRANWGTISSGFDTRIVAPSVPTGTVAAFSIGTGKAYLQFLNPASFMVGMCGVSGDTVQNLITRESAAPSTTRRNIDDMVSVGAQVAIVWMGINSITSLVTGAYNSTIADTIWSQIVDILQRLVSKGIFVIDNGDGAWEHTDTTTYPPIRAQGIRDTIIDLNSRRKAYAASSGGKIIYNDTWSLFCNPDGTWKDYRYCVDCAGSLTPPPLTQLVHPSNPAGLMLADSYNKIFKKYFGIQHPAYTRYFQGFQSSYNLLPNPDLSQVSGGVGTGWTTSVSGTSPTKTDEIIILNSKRFQSTKGVFGGPGTNVLSINAPMPIQNGGTVTVTSGQTYGIEFDVYIDDGNGNAPTLGAISGSQLYFRFRYFTAAGNNYFDIASPADFAFDKVVNGRVVFPPITMPVSSSLITSAQLTAVSSRADGVTQRLAIGAPRMIRIS